MTKADIVEKVYLTLGLSRQESTELVDHYIETGEQPMFGSWF